MKRKLFWNEPYTARPSTRRCYCGKRFYDVFDDFQCLACSGIEESVNDDLCAEGYQEGKEKGYASAVRDTLAHRPPEDYAFPEVHELPYIAWANQSAYCQTYCEGYRIGYKQVYKRHAPLVRALEAFHVQRLLLTFLAFRFEHHFMFEPRVFQMIRSLLKE